MEKGKDIINRTEKKTENVLFLILSTLYRNPPMSAYEGNAVFTGISQLEAGTKNILYQLAHTEKKKLDRIVIVESEATRNDPVVGIADSFWEDEWLSPNGVRSAVYFYKQRILDYIRRNYSKQILTNPESLIENYEEVEEHFPEDVLYSEEELKTLFYDIPTGEEPKETHIYKEESLELFMEIIRGIKGNEDNSVQLYVDTQGGFRSAIQQINAVLELLRDQDVKIMGRYAIPFGSKTKDGKYIIKEVSEAYKSYELVTSMTEFKQYGRGKGLASFFNEKQDDFTRRIVELIQRISGAIALCNIVEFEESLKSMQGMKKEIKEGNAKVDSQIRLVFQDIIDNYDFLLQENRTQFDIVKWCVQKYYYQQAITIIESRMPQMLIECGYLTYKKQEPVENINPDAEDALYPYTRSLTEAKLCSMLKERWKGEANFLFEQWIYCNEQAEIYGKSKKNKKTKYFGNEMNLSGNLVKEWRNKYENYTVCTDLQCKLKGKPYGKFYYFRYKNFDQFVDGQEREQKIFRMFAALSKVLKLTRNQINHANSTISEVEIRDALDAYIEMGEELELNRRWKPQGEISRNIQNHKITQNAKHILPV